MKSLYRRAHHSLLVVVTMSVPLFSAGISSNQARVGLVKGDVKILQTGAAEWAVLKQDLPLESGDQILTGEDGEVEIAVAENVLWLLLPNSQFVIGRTETSRGTFSMPEGTLLGKVSHGPAGESQEWQFQMPTAMCSIKGTEFGIVMSKKEGMQLGVYSGQVEVRTVDLEDRQPPYLVAAKEEGQAQRGQTFLKKIQLGSEFVALSKRLPEVRERSSSIQNAWTSFTKEERLLVRRKFLPEIKPPQKRPVRPHNRRQKRKFHE